MSQSIPNPSISIIMPARNEADGLRRVLPRLKERFAEHEIVVVNDGSDDDTEAVCLEHGVVVVSHPYPMGNGAAVKSGTRRASGDLLVFLDADGQHDPEDIPRLLEKLDQGFDMAVGARDAGSQAGIGRLCANTIYNWVASRMVGQKVEDLTSGFRAVRAEKFREFLHLYPNGFSYPTTSTMAFFRAGYAVGYLPITADKRIGKSHIRPLKDGIRFLLIIFKVATLYSPLKVFVPVGLLFFLTGLFYYGYTFIYFARFTNMSALLFSTSVLIFLIGLVSEQITALLYTKTNGG